MTLLTTHNPMHALSADTAAELMRMYIDQDTDPLLVGACLALMAQREPRADELFAFAQELLKVAEPFPRSSLRLLDTCGTGGDGASTANLSTLAALLLAHLGVPVAKHGNRAATSLCGSADVLEGLGYVLQRTPEAVANDLQTHHFAFLFAPSYHPLLGRLKEIRKRLGIPTIFNVLGPLLNPARPALQVLGVNRRSLMQPMAQALAMQGIERAFVVHGLSAEGCGMDELSIEGPSFVVEVRDNTVHEEVTLVPRELGMGMPAQHALRIESREQAIDVASAMLAGQSHPAYRDEVANAVALQAALGLVLHRDQALTSLCDGLHEAKAVLQRGFTAPFAREAAHA